MAVNRGKQFEDLFRQGIEELDNISLDRFPDPMAGFLGVRNICDFGLYKCPFQYYIECKTLTGNTLNYKSAITENQWQGLQDKSKLQGVNAGVLVWYMSWDITVFVNIKDLTEHRAGGAKSLNIKDLHQDKVSYVELEGRKKKVFFDYNFKGFLGKLEATAIKSWGRGSNG